MSDIRKVSELEVTWLRELRKNKRVALGGMVSSKVCEIHKGKGVEDTVMCFKVNRKSDWLVRELLESYDFGIQLDNVKKTSRASKNDGKYLKVDSKWYEVVNSGSAITVYVLKDSVIIGKILEEVNGYVYRYNSNDVERDKFDGVFELYDIEVDSYKRLTVSEDMLLRSYLTEFDAKVHLGSKKYRENKDWKKLKLWYHITYDTKSEYKMHKVTSKVGDAKNISKLTTSSDFKWLAGLTEEVGYETFKLHRINQLLMVLELWTNEASSWSIEQRAAIDWLLEVIHEASDR